MVEEGKNEIVECRNNGRLEYWNVEMIEEWRKGSYRPALKK